MDPTEHTTATTFDDLPHGGTDTVGVTTAATAGRVTPTRSRSRLAAAALAAALIGSGCAGNQASEAGDDSPPPVAEPAAVDGDAEAPPVEAAPVGGAYTGEAFLNGARLRATIAFPEGGGPAAYLLIWPDGPADQQLLNDTGGRVTVEGDSATFTSGGYTDNQGCIIESILLTFDVTDADVLKLQSGNGSGSCAGEPFSTDLTGWRLKRTAETIDPTEHARFVPTVMNATLTVHADTRRAPMTVLDATFDLVDDKGRISGTAELFITGGGFVKRVFTKDGSALTVTGTRTGNRVEIALSDFTSIDNCDYRDTTLTLGSTDGARWTMIDSAGTRDCDGTVHDAPVVAAVAKG